MEFLQTLAGIPPISWIVGLFAWIGHLPPVRWLGWLGTTPSWLWDHLPWFVGGGLLVATGIELLWWGVVVMRAKEVGFDPHKCEYHPRSGNRRKHPVQLDKALYRQFSWPKLGLPMYVAAVLMFALGSLGHGLIAYAVMAAIWFLTSPLRVMGGLHVAREYYKKRHPKAELPPYLTELWGYYRAGLSLTSPNRYERDEPEPPFVGDSWPYRALNAGWRIGRKLGKFWQVWRIFSVVRFWKLIGQLIISWCWPVAALVSPFCYMEMVSEYERWRQPWWRAYKGNKNTAMAYGPVVEGTVTDVTDSPFKPPVSTRRVSARRS